MEEDDFVHPCGTLNFFQRLGVQPNGGFKVFDTSAGVWEQSAKFAKVC